MMTLSARSALLPCRSPLDQAVQQVYVTNDILPDLIVEDGLGAFTQRYGPANVGRCCRQICCSGSCSAMRSPPCQSQLPASVLTVLLLQS